MTACCVGSHLKSSPGTFEGRQQKSQILWRHVQPLQMLSQPFDLNIDSMSRRNHFRKPPQWWGEAGVSWTGPPVLSHIWVLSFFFWHKVMLCSAHLPSVCFKWCVKRQRSPSSACLTFFHKRKNRVIGFAQRGGLICMQLRPGRHMLITVSKKSFCSQKRRMSHFYSSGVPSVLPRCCWRASVS